MRSQLSGGLSAFSSTIGAIEARFRGPRGASPDLLSSKKLKPTKEELERYATEDMVDFIDDSELIQNEEDQDEVQVGAFKARALDLDDLSSNSSSGEDSLEHRVSSRSRFLAKWDTWTPSRSVLKDLIELRRINALAFNSAGLSKLSPKIESLMMKIDKAVTATSPNHKRTKGYLAKLVATFPPPMTRAHVTAHLRRLSLRRRIEGLHKRLGKLTKQCQSALQLRLGRPGAVLEPRSEPLHNLPSVPSAALALLRASNQISAAEDDALDEIALWAFKMCKAAPGTLSFALISEFKDALVAWSQRVRPTRATQLHLSPTLAFIAAREWVHAASLLCQGLPVFVWDGESRSLASCIGACILTLSRTIATHEAWVSRRARELELPSSSRAVSYFLKSSVSSPVPLFMQCERKLAQIFPSVNLRRSARLNEALRDSLATCSGDFCTFFEFDEVPILPPPIAAPSLQTASMPPPPPPTSTLPAKSNGNHAQGAPKSSTTANNGPSVVAKSDGAPSNTKSSEEPSTTAPVTAAASDEDIKPPRVSPIHPPVTDFVFVPVRGCIYETKKFDVDDFPPI